MIRYFYDCEFIEDGRTIELISIGIVAEDGREFYAVNRDLRWRRIAHRTWWAPWRWTVRLPWLVENVVPHLPQLHGDVRLHLAGSGPLGLIDWQSPHFMPRARIAARVRDFLLSGDGKPELWADCGAYDHVVLMWLWGDMSRKPDGLPYYTKDLQQEIERLGNPPLPEQASGVHNALADARYNLVRARALGLVS